MTEKNKTILKFPREEDEESDMLMSKALFVEEVDDEEETDQPPTDGMEYLRMVIKERRRVPATVTAEIHPEKLKAATTTLCGKNEPGFGRNKAPVPEAWCPSLRWQNQQVADFSDVRQKLGKHRILIRSSGQLPEDPKLPGKSNEMLWCIFCFGSKMWQEVKAAKDTEADMESVASEPPSEGAEGEEEEEEANEAKKEEEEDEETRKKLDTIMEECSEGTPPSVSLLVSLPIHVVESVLEFQVSWLKLVGWRPDFGAWLFALLARIEKPLNPDLGSVLRDLALYCSHQRHRLAGDTARDEKTEEQVAAFNLFICLVAKYFGQSDLADQELG